VLEQGKVLLLRYSEGDGSTFLAAPGGGVHMMEGLPKAAIREAREETGLEVNPYPHRVLFVEELLSRKHRHIKIWLLCSLVGGNLTKTPEAKKEGIIEVGWYSKGELANEVVYPSPLKTTDWQAFLKKNWKTRYMELRKANF
jgi:ADP-ribose pyrophosphatase YjhB (NUDIX family)